MNDIRPIKKIITGEEAVDGAGVRLVRVFGHRETGDLDPFLMLDAFDSTDPDDYVRGFPWHPHRGIETVTYLIDGDIEHGDSLGNHGSIRGGECQWMTAGSGIIHQEMPQPTGRMRGIQLWLNLPARDKMVHPKYGDIRAGDIPVVEGDGSTVRIVSGAYAGTHGAFEGKHVQATVLDVTLGAGKNWALPVGYDETVFTYILEGEGRFGREGAPLGARHAVLFGAGDTVRVVAGQTDIRMLVFAARPLGEPIAWGGPIVMNTREELDLAFRELDAGTFIRHDRHDTI